MNEPSVIFVVAMAENRVIGKDNEMPWHVRSDLKRFKALTWGKPMIMGRKTFQSIGKPLHGRESVVITSDPAFHAEGVHIVHSPEAALERARQLTVELRSDEIAVIGGGEIFRLMLNEAHRIYVTEIHAQPAGDAFFPELDPGQWLEESRTRHEAGEKDDHAFSYIEYVPRASSDVT